MARIKQGDAYSLPVEVALEGRALELDEIEAVEFVLGDLVSRWPETAAYDEALGAFLVPLSQADTFRLPKNAQVKLDVRVKFKSGDVVGTDIQTVDIAEALSRAVL